MRRLLLTLFGSAFLLSTPASALDRFVISAPVTFSIENMLLNSAKERHSFEKAGIDFKYEPSTSMEAMVPRLKEGGDLDAHVYPAPAWQANYNGRTTDDGKKLCFTMVMPIVSRFFLAVVATTPEWKNVKAVVDSGPGFTTLVVERIVAQHGLTPKSYEPLTVKGFTMPRMNAMFESDKAGKPAATAAADPLFEYIRRTQGVHVLSDVGSHPIVNSGLMVRCGDLKSPQRRELIGKVVRVLSDEMHWILDQKVSDPMLLPWMRAILEKDGYDKKYGTSFAGRAVAPDTVEPAARMLERSRSVMAATLPSKKLMEDTVKILLGTVPPDFSGTYYDFSLMPKD